MGVYLLEHPPARRQYIDPRRSSPSGAIVTHTAESITDLLAPDYGAEDVARFISTRTTAGSYHSIVDADSIVHVGQYLWEMFHEGTGGNKWSLGLAWATRADDWSKLPTWWVSAAILNGAREAVNMINWIKKETGIIVPVKRITAAEYHDRKPGFIGHGELDPTRRHDPGDGFPWEYFLNLVNLKLQEEQDDDMVDEYLRAFVTIAQAYRYYLDREGSPFEIGEWAESATDKVKLNGVINSIANSPEAQAVKDKRGG